MFNRFVRALLTYAINHTTNQKTHELTHKMKFFSHYTVKSRLSLILRVNVVLNRTVVVDRRVLENWKVWTGSTLAKCNFSLIIIKVVSFHFLKKMHFTRRKNLTGLVCFKIFLPCIIQLSIIKPRYCDYFLTPYVLEKKGCGAYWKTTCRYVAYLRVALVFRDGT